MAAGRHEGHFCHQTDICPQGDRVTDSSSRRCPGEINPKKGMEKQPDMNPHSLQASLEGNLGTGHSESGSFFSPLIIPP